MNQERRCMKQADSSRRSSLQSSDFPAEPWHSTPVKKHQDARPDAVASGRDRMVKQENGPFQRRLPLSTSLPLTQDCQTAVCDLEYSTLQRQRRELQLLMAELKDRDQELNNMAATHHTQLLAWQQDRQRVLLLEERCARLEEELKQQHEVLRAVGRRVQTAEAQEKSSQRELSAAQQQLQDLQHTQRHSSQLQQELEDRNHALNSTITLLSSQVGQLQAREEELSAMLKLKDKDVTEAIAHIQDLSSRLRMQEDSQRELRTRESKIFAELEEVKRLYREVRHENTRLKDELEEKTLENSTQREEVIRLKQETQLLRRDLLISGEGESWKDEMLELSRSKQERTEVELRCLRQVCANQQNDLQLLKLNLESTQETLKVQRSHGSQGEATCSPQPASPVLWTSVNPGGSPRAIYLSSPTTPKQGFQEAECTSTHRLQRLLEESRQMVATLEGLSLEPKSPSPRPAHAHTPSPSHHPSHSPSPNHASAGNLNGCYDYSSSQHSSSEVHSQNSSGHSSTLIRKIHHLTKNSPSKPGGDTSQ
ncbi:coiled-coil domain-containing protein 62 isoform X5 [Alosa alosa]|uniref:coiled-coil domain-containing protein 62 isoform X5 n=1 Tax=Alosa alosa TaxID=278164 RepID=UPI0020151A07|nr:coiled-coil domain-containing protein 62 isoform X5 [Alosa alosa]